jgi:hypothetical protein
MSRQSWQGEGAVRGPKLSQRKFFWLTTSRTHSAVSTSAESIRGLSLASSRSAFKCVGLAFILATTGLAQGTDVPRSVKPVVYDTGYEIFDVTVMPSLYWVDNDRLLFSGMKAGRGPRPDLRKLYMWDARTKSITLYADAKNACVVDGVIRYTVRVDNDAGKAIVREGAPGSEKEVEETLPSKHQPLDPPIYSNFTCRTHLRSQLRPPAPRFRHVAVLRQGDGYLDLEPGGGPNLLEDLRAPKKNLILYQASGKAIELPLTWDEQFSELQITFSSYRKAYVLRPRAPRGSPLGIHGPWPRGQRLWVYLLKADGQVEATSIPYLPTEYITHPQPVASGWIFGGGNFYKAAGLYVFDRSTVSKLIDGLVKETAASPNGCKAAVGIQEKHLEMGTPTLMKIFDFCAGGR